jgi:hypothetical protein
VTQRSSEKARGWAQQFSIAVWWATRVEVYGAIARLSRSGELTGKERSDAVAANEALADGWREVVPSDEVRDTAAQLLDTYPLRAADSLQLSAALVWCRNRPKGRTFISADTRL